MPKSGVESDSLGVGLTSPRAEQFAIASKEALEDAAGGIPGRGERGGEERGGEGRGGGERQWRWFTSTHPI
jgi:hypothetical protein